MDVTKFIEQLKKIEGAIDYDGNYSTQVMFKLANGKNLRIGIGDEENSEIFCDQFEGLGIITRDGKIKHV